jgi:hypothetical protein
VLANEVADNAIGVFANRAEEKAAVATDAYQMNTVHLPVSDSVRRQRWLVWIVLVALALRAAPLFQHGLVWAKDNDSERYIALAQGLRSGCGFAMQTSDGCAPAELLRTPGYPLFLATMPGLRAALAAQVVLSALLCLVLGWTTAKVWGLGAGIVAGLLVAMDGASVVQSARLMTDVLFQFLIGSAVLAQMFAMRCLALKRWVVALGLGAAGLFGAAILVRPVASLLLVFASLPFLLAPSLERSQRFALCVAAALIPALVTLAWSARNYAERGVWTVSSDGPLILYYHYAAAVAWYRGGQSYGAEQVGLQRALGVESGNYLSTPPELGPEMVRRSFRIFLADPAATFAVALRSILWLALVPDRANLAPVLGIRAGVAAVDYGAALSLGRRMRELVRSPLLTLLVGAQMVLIMATWCGIAMALIGAWRGTLASQALVLPPLLVGLTLLVVCAVPEALARYRMPAFAPLAIVAGAGWCGRNKTAVPKS